MFRRMVREDFPDLRSLAQNVPAAFINSPQIVDIPRPISSKIVYVGGIAMKKSSDLSKVSVTASFRTHKTIQCSGIPLISWKTFLESYSCNIER